MQKLLQKIEKTKLHQEKKNSEPRYGVIFENRASCLTAGSNYGYLIEVWKPGKRYP